MGGARPAIKQETAGLVPLCRRRRSGAVSAAQLWSTPPSSSTSPSTASPWAVSPSRWAGGALCGLGGRGWGRGRLAEESGRCGAIFCAGPFWETGGADKAVGGGGAAAPFRRARARPLPGRGGLQGRAPDRQGHSYRLGASERGIGPLPGELLSCGLAFLRAACCAPNRRLGFGSVHARVAQSRPAGSPCGRARVDAEAPVASASLRGKVLREQGSRAPRAMACSFSRLVLDRAGAAWWALLSISSLGCS